MNRLKLLFPFLITLFILVSCSSDDNSVMNSNSSKLVGVWKPVKEVSACTNGTEYMDEYNTCEQKSRVSFFSDGTYKYIAFDNDEGECIENNFVETDTWSLNGEILTAVKDGNNEDDDDDDTLSGVFTYFELTDDTVRIGLDLIDLDFPCEEGGIGAYSYVEFKRVE